VAKELVGAVKFARAQAGTKLLARAMAEVLPPLSSQHVIVPVPTATNRIRQRGFDQAELIAKELSQLTGLEMRKLLLRIDQTRQVGRSRAERLKQLERSFITKTNIRTYKVLLVDDVLTTGATLEAAARSLRFSGVKSVDALVFAQA
jgi:ComF family protein